MGRGSEFVVVDPDGNFSRGWDVQCQRVEHLVEIWHAEMQQTGGFTDLASPPILLHPREMTFRVLQQQLAEWLGAQQ